MDWVDFNTTLSYIYKQRRDFLYCDAQLLTGERLQNYCAAIDTPGNRIYGFIDGTHRAICQPSTIDQKLFYSGYKKVHLVKFQAIIAPDGLIIHLAGSFPFYYSFIIRLFYIYSMVYFLFIHLMIISTKITVLRLQYN